MNHGKSIEKKLIFFFRIAFVVVSLLLLHAVIPTGSPESIVLFGAIIGASLGVKLASSKLRFLGMCATLFAAYFIFLIGVNIFMRLTSHPIGLYIQILHLEIFILCIATSLLSTWSYLKIPWYFIFEASFLIFLAVGALSFHRNFKLDMPQFINTLSWDIGVSPLATFVLLGIALLLINLGYLVLSSRALSIFLKHKINRVQFTSQKALSYSILFLTLLIVSGVSFSIFSYYQNISAGLLSNGVGTESSEGLSPLSFSSALGSTNQPAALLRLENDYPKNPTSPMLYLRESALSVFNGRELVLGPEKLDSDIPKVSPSTPFVHEEDKKLQQRAPLTQILYLLTDHKLSFGADYPIQITPLKNPNPQKFKGGSFKAISLVPQYAISDLGNFEVGNPLWSEQEKKSYIGAHTDPRYSELSKKITEGLQTPAEKIKAVTEFLAEHTIYTLTPNHKEDPKADPVAPYLFGDGRGYCVHIAHASVYLLRAAGIPSRIATGYLSDLSQARDGHVLLRMSDRHAWAEVYIKDYGWLPFDTQPLRVESHAETEVDQKLLEELMGMINPAEELLPETPEEYKEPPTSTTEIFASLSKALLLSLISLLLAFILTKLYLWYGFLLYRNNISKLKACFRASLARLLDSGLNREYGETLKEYSERAQVIYSEEILNISDPVIKLKYGGDVTTMHMTPLSLPQKLSRFQRIKAIISPRSSFAYWMGDLI